MNREQDGEMEVRVKSYYKVRVKSEIFATRFQPDITESDIKSYVTNDFSDAESISIVCMYVCMFFYFSAATAQIKAQKHNKS